MLLVVIDVRSLFKFAPANCSARIFKPFSSGLFSLLTLTSGPLSPSQRVRPSSSGCQIWMLVRQWTCHWTPRLLRVCQKWLVPATPEASRLRGYRTYRVYTRGRQIVARHFPCCKHEDPPDILPSGRRDTEESSEPAQCLGDSGRAGGAESPHYGLPQGQPSSPRLSPTLEVEGRLFGPLLSCRTCQLELLAG